MQPDIRTIVIMLTMTCLLVPAALLIFHAGRFRRDGMLLWVFGYVVQAVAWMFLGLRGIVADSISIMVHDIFLIGSYSLLYAAVREFQTRSYRWGILLLPVIVAFFIVLAFFDNPTYRIAFMAVLPGLQIGAIILVLLRDAAIQERRSQLLTASFFSIAVLLYLYRFLEVLIGPSEYILPFAPRTFGSFAFIMGIDVVILTSIGFLLMTRERAEGALQQERDLARKYLDIAGVMLLVIGSDQRVTLINKKGCEVLECKADEIVGKNWFDNFIPERMRSEVKEIFQKLIDGETNLYEHLEGFILLPKSGKERLIAWHNSVLRDNEGRIVGTLSSGDDITERKKSEESLLRSEGTAQRLVRETEIIAAIGRIISSRLNIEEIYEQFAQEAKKLIKFDRISVNFINRKEATVTVPYAWGTAVEGRQPGNVIPFIGSGTEEVFKTRTDLLIQTEDEDEIATRFHAYLPNY